MAGAAMTSWALGSLRLGFNYRNQVYYLGVTHSSRLTTTRYFA
jgi:hypothetical protein